ncbi:hypothetical protein AXG93_1040s1050 [Marchantia polymorpha subsp. ruderalis]|uniref:Uncharacterized protein n=1 Tax=Marchantia polymorpha subsp. ruderalis TaxID=1480154 RepID=A0A176VGI9_MARPO|nr:hypothetical protein AXG93_1040s1050 [Marchantia polymorpha subsp. ruderalis]
MTSTVLCPFDVEMRLQQESGPQGLSYQDFTTSELGALSRALVAGSPREPAVKDLKDSHFPLGAVGSAAGESDFSKRSRSRTVEWSPVEVSTLIEAYISIYVVKRFLTSKDWAEFTRMVNSRVLNGNRCPDQCSFSGITTGYGSQSDGNNLNRVRDSKTVDIRPILDVFAKVEMYKDIEVMRQVMQFKLTTILQENSNRKPQRTSTTDHFAGTDSVRTCHVTLRLTC